MQKLVTIFLVVMLAGSVTLPMAFSDHEKSSNGAKENDDHENKNGTKIDYDNDHDKVRFGFSNATNISFTLPNGTKMMFPLSNGTNVGKQISGFIHQMREIFEQQEKQSKQTIKDCRAKAKNASSSVDRHNIMDECKAKLKEQRQQFRDQHKQFQADFKQFREMVVGSNQEIHEKSSVHNGTKIQSKTQTFPRQHGLEQGLKLHGNHGKGYQQKHDRED